MVRRGWYCQRRRPVRRVISLKGRNYGGDCTAQRRPGGGRRAAPSCGKALFLWNSRDLDSFVDALLLDSREGQRQGLPPEVAQEMVFIAQINAGCGPWTAPPAYN